MLCSVDRWIQLMLKHCLGVITKCEPNADTKTHQTDSLHEQNSTFRPWTFFGLGSFTFEPTSEATQGPQIFAMDEDDSPRRGFIPESSRHGTWAVYGCSEGDTHSFCTKLVFVFCLHHSFLKKKTDNSAYSHTHRYHRYIYIYT